MLGFTARELWTILHGMGLGGLLVLGFSGVMFGFWFGGAHSAVGVMSEGSLRRLTKALTGLTILAWLTVILGTYFPYAWFRATPPQGADLTKFPQAYLYATPGLTVWEDYGMEWKEHLAWLAPILMTAALAVLKTYKLRISERPEIQKALTVFLWTAFGAAIVVCFLGALITKIAPVR